MITFSDFVSKYENYSDEELNEVYANITDYSDDAQKAFNIVIEKKGGLTLFLKRIKEKRIVETEIGRIAKETVDLGIQGIDSSFIKNTTKSTILTAEEVNEIITSRYVEVQLAIEDKKIKPRTIFGSIIGGGVASIIGGTLWGLQMIYSNAIFSIFFIGLVLLCYGIIRATTKQSKYNLVVLIATAISIVLAVVFGQFLFAVVGFKG